MADETVEAVRRSAFELTGSTRDFQPLLEMIGDASIVMIGEASHGTHEFYRARAEITQCLIAQKGFNAVAVEADWPDAYRVNRYVRGLSDDQDAVESLAGFVRFPTWMWRNADVVDFIGWLRDRNDGCNDSAKAGFYGIDLYSLYGSMEAVIEYLEKVDPDAAKRARYRYACFEHFGEDSQAYGYAASFGMSKTCESEVIAQLVELQQRSAAARRASGGLPRDEAFYAEQNARLVKNAEEYYRSMFGGRISSWNLRDTHMAETVDALIAHLLSGGVDPKIVVWAHNSHLGDARATEMGDQGELNVGQLLRERYGDRVRNIGFTTYTGTVTAASDWDAPAERKNVRPGLDGSYEELFHRAAAGNFGLVLRNAEVGRLLEPRLLERAIGVIYAPATERLSHYFHASLPQQFDAVLHYDTSRAVEPLERRELRHTDEPPETFPSSF